MGSRGKVYLVGAGPGDPGLITLKAVDLLRRAEVVVYDALVNESLLRFAPPTARRIFAGKRGATHAMEQGEIEALLIREAKKGRVVVRLKGGDPFVFGRGGEEAEAVAQAGIDFEVVPGVSSAIAAPAYAGIPVTHRDLSSSVVIVTGHGADDEEVRIDWNSLARIDTVVFLMGVSTLPTIVERLIDAGRAPDTPAAVVEWGTTPRQKTVTGTLATIVKEAAGRGIRAPAVTVVGEVVSARPELSWFESKPLFGRRIIVTRSREQASQLSSRLGEEGAEVLEIPTIEIRPPRSGRALDRAIGRLSRYDWLIFTSVNGVEFFFRRLKERKKDLRTLGDIQIAAIGPATARAVERRGLQVEKVAPEFRAEGLLKAFSNDRLRGQRILIPRAREAREILANQLRRRGARVEVVEAYRAVKPAEGGRRLRQLLREGSVDLITFASSSTVENFLAMVGRRRSLLAKLRKIPVASIGPITTRTAKREGFKVIIQPRRYTIQDLVKTILNFSSREE